MDNTHNDLISILWDIGMTPCTPHPEDECICMEGDEREYIRWLQECPMSQAEADAYDEWVEEKEQLMKSNAITGKE